MRFITSLLLVFQVSLFGIQTDFDVAVVGTSPVCLLEAIHHLARNERVLLIEADEKYGGAWKYIDICGIAHADLGCHQIGSDNRLKTFFEDYFGCQFICLDHPAQTAAGMHARCPNGYYFSGGCHELITQIKSRMDSYPTLSILNQKLENVFVDAENGCIALSIGDVQCTTSKLKITPMSHFHVENSDFSNRDFSSHWYYHLYVLVQDETPSSFTYSHGIVGGMIRAMNLTPFLELPSENLQLIVFQTYNKNEYNEAQKFVDALKSKGMLTANAQILSSDTYTYLQSSMNASGLAKYANSLVEVLDTSSFAGMARQLEKWKSSMTPLVAP